MGGKRVADDQHEIIDLLYTKETDRRAKKMAKQAAREAAAAKKVATPAKASKASKAKRRQQASTADAPEAAATTGSTKTKAAPSAKQAAKTRKTRQRIAASLAAAACFGGYLYATGYSFDPDVRQDQAACERITAALPEGEVTTAADAETSAASLYRLARFKMSADLGSEVRRTADSMLRARTVLTEGTTGSDVQAELASLSERVKGLREACSTVGA